MSGDIERSGSIRRSQITLSPFVKQLFDYFKVPLVSGDIKRSSSILNSRINLCPFCKQLFDYFTGDYAYIEHFPLGMYSMEPPPNVARHQQIFQLWIRPVEPPTAKFALRMALYQLDKLVKEGIPQDGFERTRDFLTKYVNVLMRTKSAELGYAIDSIWYAVPNYVEMVKNAMAKITRDDVNRAIKSRLRTNRVVIVAVSKDGEALKKLLAGDEPSPMTYNSPKPDAITEVDKIVEKWPLHLSEADIKVVPVNEIFQ